MTTRYLSLVSMTLLWVCALAQACPTSLAGGKEPAGAPCPNDVDDWQIRSRSPGVFYRNTFDYDNRADYLAAAHSLAYADGENGSHKLELERKITLSGHGASRHNWFAVDGANEAGPAWHFSFDGPGAKTTKTRKTRFYLQYSFYADEEWVNFVNTNGEIKMLILFNPSQAPFATGEVVVARMGRGPWIYGFRVTNEALAWSLVWKEPHFVEGDDTFYTFWDGGYKKERGLSDATDINLFEQRWGPRRRNAVRDDPDYQSVPHIEPGKWYTMEVFIDVEPPQSVIKIWFAERGSAPILLEGLMSSGLRANDNTFRGGHLLSRAEDTRTWVSRDTFIIFDELLASDQPLDFPGGFLLPYPGDQTPPDWPPANARPRN